ncbi:MAG: hypothetical protein ACE5IR_14100 [bacterium]
MTELQLPNHTKRSTLVNTDGSEATEKSWIRRMRPAQRFLVRQKTPDSK